MPFARVDPRVRSWSASSPSGGRLVKCWHRPQELVCGRASFTSEVLASSFYESCTASVASVVLRGWLCMRLAIRFRSDCGAWTAVGGAGCMVQTYTKTSNPSSLLSPLILMLPRVSQEPLACTSRRSRGCMLCISRVVFRGSICG